MSEELTPRELYGKKVFFKRQTNKGIDKGKGTIFGVNSTLRTDKGVYKRNVETYNVNTDDGRQIEIQSRFCKLMNK